MKAKAEEARANVIQAEAEIPLAIAGGFSYWQYGYNGLLSIPEP